MCTVFISVDVCRDIGCGLCIAWSKGNKMKFIVINIVV